jgi:hypothetical protein
MKRIKNISVRYVLCIYIVLIIFYLIGCQKSHKKVSSSSYIEQVFPQTLLYEKIPLHPLCIIATLQDKSSQPICIEDLQADLFSEYDLKEHTYSYDLEKKECAGSWKIKVENDYTPRSYAHYVYIGSYKNKEIIHLHEYPYGACEKLERLLIIVREKDTIYCAQELAMGHFNNVTVNNEIVRLEQSLPGRCIDHILPRENIIGLEKEIVSISNDFPLCRDAVQILCIYEIDLNDSLLELKICGISLFESGHYYWPCNKQEKCLCEVALKYIEAGINQLDLVQTESFIKEVWKCIAKT